MFYHMAVGQNQWYLFGVGAPPILVYSSVDWDVHWGYGLLTHGHIGQKHLTQVKDIHHAFIRSSPLEKNVTDLPLNLS